MRAPRSRPRAKSSLHAALQEVYSREGGKTEAKVGDFRVDVLKGDLITEIQIAGLYKIKQKVRVLLLMGYKVKVVVPLQSVLVEPGGTKNRDQRYKIFQELSHFVDVFPAPGLEVDFLMLKELRTWKKVKSGRHYVVPKGFMKRDTVPLAVIEEVRLREAHDLLKLIDIPDEKFTARGLALRAGLSRRTASRACYVLRRTGVLNVEGMIGRAYLYRLAASPQPNSDTSRILISNVHHRGFPLNVYALALRPFVTSRAARAV